MGNNNFPSILIGVLGRPCDCSFDDPATIVVHTNLAAHDPSGCSSQGGEIGRQTMSMGQVAARLSMGAIVTR
jgi:hypothetical protein